jgi:DNA invertase Pin-like site-specific DNA recombinase
MDFFCCLSRRGAGSCWPKMVRVSRDAAFLLSLAKSGVKFVAADMPHADALTIGILAVVAENERRLISERTKAALQAAKARGVKLGNPNGAAHLQGDVKARAVATLRAKAQSVADGLRATIEAIRAEGITSANGIARALNERDIEGPRGGQWTARSVINVMARL